MKHKLTRDFYIPKGYTLIHRDDKHGVEVWGQTEPRVVAMLFGGKRAKPDWHYRFNSLDRLWAKIDETLNNLDAWAKRKAEWKAERDAPHDVKVGDIFRCSWGYDQTNIEYFQCTKVFGAMIEICKIACDSQDIEFMQGRSVPMLDAFVGDPMRKKVKMYGGEPSVAIYSFANAHRMKPVAKIGDKPLYESSHWTAYA